MTTRLALLAFCSTLAAFAWADSPIRAGASVTIDQPVADDVHAVGARVMLSAPVDGKARLTGAHVEIAAGGSVTRDAVLTGGDVVMKGTVERDLRATGGHVMIDGTVRGDANVNAGSLELGPNARIDGKLRYRAESLDKDAAAQVTGGIVRTHRHERSWGHDSLGHSVTRALWTLGLMVLAAVIAGALPGPVRRMQDELRTRPWLASLFGVVALICVPIAAVLVMVTIIGIPIGLLALMGYAALVLVGYVCASVVLGGLVLDRWKADSSAQTAWRVGAAVVAMLVIASLGRVPFVGGLVALAALVVGMGVIVGAIVHRARPDAEAPAA